MLALSLSAFNLAVRRNFVSKAVNKPGAVSMLVYIIHRNNLFVKYLQGEYFDYAITRFGSDALIPAIRAATLRKHVYHRLPRALAPDSD